MASRHLDQDWRYGQEVGRNVEIGSSRLGVVEFECAVTRDWNDDGHSKNNWFTFYLSHFIDCDMMIKIAFSLYSSYIILQFGSIRSSII